jgi:hypothetical protein
LTTIFPLPFFQLTMAHYVQLGPNQTALGMLKISLLSVYGIIFWLNTFGSSLGHCSCMRTVKNIIIVIFLLFECLKPYMRPWVLYATMQ